MRVFPVWISGQLTLGLHVVNKRPYDGGSALLLIRFSLLRLANLFFIEFSKFLSAKFFLIVNEPNLKYSKKAFKKCPDN